MTQRISGHQQQLRLDVVAHVARRVTRRGNDHDAAVELQLLSAVQDSINGDAGR